VRHHPLEAWLEDVREVRVHECFLPRHMLNLMQWKSAPGAYYPVNCGCYYDAGQRNYSSGYGTGSGLWPD
jgi:hypothetical protein